MKPLPGLDVSYWVDSTAEQPHHPSLVGDRSCDVVVLGGGIAGLSTASLLQRAGLSVGVVEADRLLRGVTGNTTAKLTAQHGLLYADLLRGKGLESARAYAASAQAGVAHVRAEVVRLDVADALQDADSHVYAPAGERLDDLQAEAEAAAQCGLPMELVTSTELPYEVAGALRLAGQAQIHPRRYLLAVAEELCAAGGWVAESTRAVDVEQEGELLAVRTEGGAVVRAQHVVVATHVPFLDRGGFFATTHPFRDLVLAFEVEPGAMPRGTYLSTEEPSHSVRGIPLPDGRALLVVGGEGFKTGEDEATDERWLRLEAWARERFAVGAVTHRWATQDAKTTDAVPFVGAFPRGPERLWVATGFGGWGMSGGSTAALLLRDLITGAANEWASLYDPSRVAPLINRDFLAHNLSAAKHWVRDRIGGSGDVDLAPGEGAVVVVDGQRCAVSCAPDGTRRAVSAVCTHLGCVVRWNRGEQSWDCPCHGSRFAADGAVLHGPAVTPLAPVELPAGVSADDTGLRQGGADSAS